MRKPLITITIIFGIAVIIFGIIVWIYPQWLDIPGGWLILLGAILVAVAELGDKIKGWADFLFGEGSKSVKKDQGSKSSATPKLDVTKNVMIGKNRIRSEHDNAGINNNTMIGENQIDTSRKAKVSKQK